MRFTHVHNTGGVVSEHSGMYREVAAYVLDKESGEHAAGVPETCLAKLHASELEGKVGSLQVRQYFLHSTSTAHYPQLIATPLWIISYSCYILWYQAYVRNARPAEEFGRFCEYSAEEVQRIAILDIRICNMDRHEGNLLVNKVCLLHQYKLWAVCVRVRS